MEHLQPHRARQSGFTLVELLVVIGIIAVLISILMPALNMARESAKATKCLSNMRQIGTVLVAYINDNQGWIPPQTASVSDFADPLVYQSTSSGNWSVLAALIPYFDNVNNAYAVWVCPTAFDSPYPDGWTPAPPSNTSYLTNAAVVNRKLSRITNTSQIIWLQEDTYSFGMAWLRPAPAGTSGTPPEYDSWCYANGSYWGQEYSNTHNAVGILGTRRGGGNVAYLDGHAEYQHNGALHPSDFGLVGIPGQSTSSDPNTVAQTVPYFGAFDD